MGVANASAGIRDTKSIRKAQKQEKALLAGPMLDWWCKVALLNFSNLPQQNYHTVAHSTSKRMQRTCQALHTSMMHSNWCSAYFRSN